MRSRTISGIILLQDFSITGSKVHYLPFGIDTDLFSPGYGCPGKMNDTIEIFSNRGFFPVYDNETLIRGFALAYRKDSRLRLTLKGEGPGRAEDPEPGDRPRTVRIRLLSRKKPSYAEVPRDYRQADIFITTSVSDGTPVSVLEAMASGLPCIATNVGGIPGMDRA